MQKQGKKYTASDCCCPDFPPPLKGPCHEHSTSFYCCQLCCGFVTGRLLFQPHQRPDWHRCRCGRRWSCRQCHLWWHLGHCRRRRSRCIDWQRSRQKPRRKTRPLIKKLQSRAQQRCAIDRGRLLSVAQSAAFLFFIQRAPAARSARLARQAPKMASRPGTRISAQMILSRFCLTQAKLPKK